MNYEEMNIKTLQSLCLKRKLSFTNKPKKDLVAMLIESDKSNNDSFTLISSSDYSKLSKEEIIEMREKRFGVKVNKSLLTENSKLDDRKKRFSSKEDFEK
ncbi:hypothetical protein TUBRATIS_001900 [Tubulinosema ratisbonensis]|uniref:Uncharacterized protein n=1 Tax=Tubulinosema ratisbonensis TaxID=291195 RepID=A0A437AQJ4_9MICR|nr:hypothetical protein TUBRATIS_001900 [Tubulinosema ratisbonensis]